MMEKSILKKNSDFCFSLKNQEFWPNRGPHFHMAAFTEN